MTPAHESRSAVTVRHNFETGHRLPILPGKCQNLHGHSWWAEVTVTGPEARPGQDTIVEFGAFKAALRAWIDHHLDHGLMLGADDPLLPVLEPYGKVYAFTAPGPLWPTVENVALLLARVAQGLLLDIEHADGARVTRVTVSETHVNAATWEAGADD